MTTLLAFLGTLALLIVVHEYGHYAVARLCGVKVLRFSVGFGNILASRHDRNGTEWALSAIPLGGYVKMLDEREGPVAPDERAHAFNNQPVLQRMAVVAAGPAANLLLAILLFWLLYMGGVPVLKPVLDEPAHDTPAAMAGIRAGETVETVNGEPVESFQDLHLQSLKWGVGAPQIELQTRDHAGHLYIRRLNLGALDREQFETDPLAQLGLSRYIPPIPAVLGEVMTDSPAERAGLKPGDHILAINGRKVEYWEEVVNEIRANPGRAILLTVLRADLTLDVPVTPENAVTDGKTSGRIGAAPQIDPDLFKDLETEVHFSPLQAMQRALDRTWELSVFSLEMLGRMVLGQVSMKNLSGPITIADYAGQSASAGASSFIAFLALISISLGVLNLLPIPILDGGHLLYYFVELVTGKPVSERLQELGQRAGIAVLGFLMFFALYNDVLRLLSH